MCVCLLVSYVVKQWPNSVGQAGSEAPVAIRFGLDVAQNDIHTKHALTLVMKFVQRELEF